jgi:beta-glucosidase
MAAPEGARYLVEVRNTGTRKGDEVVQVYVRDRVASVTRPVRRLKGFRRVTLGPGASTIAEIELPPRAFSLWNMRMEEAIEPGVIDIGVGPDSVNLNCAELRIV